jgi:hypothetical protein
MLKLLVDVKLLLLVMSMLSHQVVHSHGGSGPSISQKVGRHVTLAFHFDLAAAIEFISLSIFKNVVHLLSDLGVIRHACGVHPGGNIDCIAPDVILWLPGTNDTSHHRAHIHAYS